MSVTPIQLLTLLLIGTTSFLFAEETLPETLPPLQNGQPPNTHDSLWADFDPRAEPLDVEVLREWEEDEVVMRVVRYRIGVFKGKKAMMAGVYGFPKGGTQLPGLVNIHGGGQYADHRSVLSNAKRGYATITIAWAGRISAPNYRVSPNEVKLFWENTTDNPAFKVTTDWGALDAYHAPSRNGKDAFSSIPDGSETWTLDDISSPRNNSWFLITLGARRALTFLEQQPEVDRNRLGVYGHSMGGKLTIATAATDKRVAAAAPSCGGISDRYNPNPLHHNTIGDSPALKKITCPTIFLNPANDFHGHISNLVDATTELGKTEWRVTCSAHLNHRDYPENEVATQLWFDQHLKNAFTWPRTPETDLRLKTEKGIPTFTVRPDVSQPVSGVEIYYTQQGLKGKKHHHNHINQFWHFARAEQTGNTWKAELPVFQTDKPLWVYANVIYPLKQAVYGAGYYYRVYAAGKYNLSSLIQLSSASDLQAAGVRATLKPSHLIESFSGDWDKEWFTYNPAHWSIRTHKVYHPIWAAPPGARLGLEVSSENANQLIIGLDDYAAVIPLKGDKEWQTVILNPSDFLDTEEQPMTDWTDLKELRLIDVEHLKSKTRGNEPRLIGKPWQGSPPVFRNLRWIAP